MTPDDVRALLDGAEPDRSEEIRIDSADLRGRGDLVVKALTLGHRCRRRVALNSCDLRGLVIEMHGDPDAGPVRLYECNVSGARLSGWWFRAGTDLGFTKSAEDEEPVTLVRCRIGGNVTASHRVRIAFDRCAFEKSSDVNVSGGSARFEQSDLHHAKITAASPHDVEIRGCGGLWGSSRASFFGPNAKPLDPEGDTVVRGRWRIVPSWDLIKLAVQHRLIGSVSYAAVVGLIAYAALLRWFNAQIDDLRAWALEHGTPNRWAAHLSPLPAPWPFGVLILAILVVALASTVFSFFCPPIVKHDNLHHWHRELGKSYIEYQGASFDREGWRIACTLLYVVGGTYSGVYLLVRLVVAVLYFFGFLGSPNGGT